MSEHISTADYLAIWENYDPDNMIADSELPDYLDIEDRDDRDLAYEEIADIQQGELPSDPASWTSGDDVIW